VNYSFCVIKNSLSGIIYYKVSIDPFGLKVKVQEPKIAKKPSKNEVFGYFESRRFSAFRASFINIFGRPSKNVNKLI